MTVNQQTSKAARPTQQQLAQMLAPRSVAIIGASGDFTKFGGRFLPYLRRQGFTGQIYPINPHRQEIDGHACHASLAAVPGTVDCVIYVGAGSEAIRALAGSADKGVKLVVMITAGFAEQGSDEGRAAEAELVAFVRSQGARLMGPNCVGFLNVGDRIAATAASSIEWEPQIPLGRIGLVSQSGGIGMGSVLYNALVQGTSFSYIFSTGNEGDLDLVDFANFLLHDEGTDAICLTWEAIRDGKAFLAFLAEAQRRQKPVVALVAGRSELGKEMAASHTGALAGSYEVFLSIAEKYGIAVAEDLDDLHELAQMFAKLRQAGRLVAGGRDAGQGCSAIGVSGGQIGLLADLAATAGLQFAALGEQTQATLKEQLRLHTVTNPVDMSGGSVSDPGAWRRGMSALLADPGVTIGLPVMTIARNYDSVTADLEQVWQAQPKPMVVTWSGGAFEGGGKAAMQRGPLPFFSSPARTVRGVRALQRWQRAHAALARDDARPAARQAPHPTVVAAAAQGRVALNETESKEVLSALGYPVTRETLASRVDEAVEAARAMGFPVALKGQHSRIQHKTDAGIVALGIRSEEEVRAHFGQIQERMQAHGADGIEGVLVQEMVQVSSEFLLGTRVDPVYGPMVMFGLGGVFVEQLQDVTMAPAPLSHEAAMAMILGVRSSGLLRGARGRAPIDLDLLAGMLVTLGDFAVAHVDHVAEIDINPLVTLDRKTDNLRVLDALMVLQQQKA